MNTNWGFYSEPCDRKRVETDWKSTHRKSQRLGKRPSRKYEYLTSSTIEGTPQQCFCFTIFLGLGRKITKNDMKTFRLSSYPRRQSRGEEPVCERDGTSSTCTTRTEGVTRYRTLLSPRIRPEHASLVLQE